MKSCKLLLVFFLLECSSPPEEAKETPSLIDSHYEITFSPCVCRRQDMIEQAKKTILTQGIKDYEELTAMEIRPNLESEILEDKYDQFLYDFSLKQKDISNSNLEEKELLSAEGKVKLSELNQYVNENSKANRSKSINTNYGSKGLEVIKSFQLDRKRHPTVNDFSKGKFRSPISIYEIHKK